MRGFGLAFLTDQHGTKDTGPPGEHLTFFFGGGDDRMYTKTTTPDAANGKVVATDKPPYATAGPPTTIPADTPGYAHLIRPGAPRPDIEISQVAVFDGSPQTPTTKRGVLGTTMAETPSYYFVKQTDYGIPAVVQAYLDVSEDPYIYRKADTGLLPHGIDGSSPLASTMSGKTMVSDAFLRTGTNGSGDGETPMDIFVAELTKGGAVCYDNAQVEELLVV